MILAQMLQGEVFGHVRSIPEKCTKGLSSSSVGFVASARLGPHTYAVTNDSTMWLTSLTGCHPGEVGTDKLEQIAGDQCGACSKRMYINGLYYEPCRTVAIVNSLASCAVINFYLFEHCRVTVYY